MDGRQYFSVHCADDEEYGAVEFEWDPKKAEANRHKHGIEFLDAVIVLDDDRGISLLDEHPTEERYVTFGTDAEGRVRQLPTPFGATAFG
jgi:hypothetical protein